MEIYSYGPGPDESVPNRVFLRFYSMSSTDGAGRVLYQRDQVNCFYQKIRHSKQEATLKQRSCTVVGNRSLLQCLRHLRVG